MGHERLSAAARQRRNRERRDRLIDRQHPHDFFMELSASVSQNIGPKSSVFLYAGLPGEPAFGPPAFMHRVAIMDSPEAPISHHWLDSTHISFGVVTAGLVLDRVKLEVSRFNGREPDQHRWNIETGPLEFHRRAAVLESDRGRWRCRAAGAISSIPSSSSPAWTRSAGRRARFTPRDRARLETRGNARLGPQDGARPQRRRLCRRGVAQAWRMDGLRPRRDDREPRADRCRERAGLPRRQGIARRGARFPASPTICRSAWAACSRSISSRMRWRRAYGGHNPVGAMGFVRLKLD